MKTLAELREILQKFRDERDWEQFHDPKNLAEALSIEAGELMELFLWKTKDQIQKKLSNDPEYLQDVKDELADVLSYVLHMANTLNIDLSQIVIDKIQKTEEKYPANKAKGSATKYTKL